MSAYLMQCMVNLLLLNLSFEVGNINGLKFGKKCSLVIFCSMNLSIVYFHFDVNGIDELSSPEKCSTVFYAINRLVVNLRFKVSTIDGLRYPEEYLSAMSHSVN